MAKFSKSRVSNEVSGGSVRRLFWRHPDFLITQYKIGQKVSVPKTGSIRPAVIIKTWTDRQTGGRTTTANAALA